MDGDEAADIRGRPEGHAALTAELGDQGRQRHLALVPQHDLSVKATVAQEQRLEADAMAVEVRLGEPSVTALWVVDHQPSKRLDYFGTTSRAELQQDRLRLTCP